MGLRYLFNRRNLCEIQYNHILNLLLSANKKVGLFFEFLCECIYIMHVTIKIQEYDNNNSHQFQELLQQDPEVPPLDLWSLARQEQQKNLLHPIIQRRDLCSYHLRSHHHRKQLSHSKNDQTLPPLTQAAGAFGNRCLNKVNYLIK